MPATAEIPASMILTVAKEIDIAAPISVAWDAMLEEIGPGATQPDGKPLNLKLEPWPGGRYFRDLGNNAGHFWGHVQVIKPPTLLEIHGPLFMSFAAVSHVQYRLAEQGSGTRLTLIHRAIGEITPEIREGVGKGWGHFITRIRDRAQR
jgi:hypothetical protein